VIETTVEAVSVGSAPTVSPDSSVTEAAGHLRRPEVTALVVVDGGAVVGIVTGSDIVAAVAETDAPLAVRTIMSTPVTTITPTATLSEAAETMRTAGVKQLPVLSDGDYRGVLSARTLASYLPRSTLEIEWRDDPLRVDPIEGRDPDTTE